MTPAIPSHNRARLAGVTKCIWLQERGMHDAPPAPSFEEGRRGERHRQSRQDRSRSGSPGIRLGRPCGLGFALRPGLIVRDGGLRNRKDDTNIWH